MKNKPLSTNKNLKKMNTAIVSKKEITSRIVFNQFRESRETSLVDMVTFQNGHVVSFASFLSEVSNERWCSVIEEMEIRKTSSLAKKQLFAIKYASQFLGIGGRSL